METNGYLNDFVQKDEQSINNLSNVKINDLKSFKLEPKLNDNVRLEENLDFKSTDDNHHDNHHDNHQSIDELSLENKNLENNQTEISKQNIDENNQQIKLNEEIKIINDESSNYVSLSDQTNSDDVKTKQSNNQSSIDIYNTLSDEEQSIDSKLSGQQSNNLKSVNQPVSQQEDKPADQSVDQSVSQPEDQSVDQPEDKSADQSVDQSVSQPEDQPLNQLEDKPADQSVNQSEDQSVDQSKPTENSNQLNQSSEQQKILEDKKELSQNDETNNEFFELFDNPDLLKRILKRGDEESKKPEQTCEALINLEVRNYETGELIESETGKNLTIFIGHFDIVHGVDLALPTMHIGEIAEILIKPGLHYGPQGKKPDIPSNCVLICKVELLKIKLPMDINSGCFEELDHYFNLCKRKKERGNFFFKRTEYATALFCYNKSHEILDLVSSDMVDRHNSLVNTKIRDDEHEKEIYDEINSINILSNEVSKVRLDICNNLSAVYIKLKSYNDALEAVDKALICKEDDLKAIYRKSIILTHKGDVQKAIDCLKRGIKLDPQNRTFHNELSKLKIKLKKEIKEERELYAKMLQTKKIKITKKTSSSRRFNYLTTGLVISGVVLGTYILYRKFNKS